MHTTAVEPGTVRPGPFLAVACCLIAALAAFGWRASAQDGDESSFVPTTPCRLFDFRPAPLTVGPRSTPLEADESHRLQVTGSEGECVDIPADATGIALNITVTDPTEPSFLSVVPGDVSGNPGVSSLNYLPGAPPTPNKVDVALDGSGGIRLYNFAGEVYVLGDVVGYYTGSSLIELADRVRALEDIIEPPGPITIEQGIGWISNSGDPISITYWENGVEFDGGGSGGTGQLSLIGPTQVGTTPYRLESVTYCMTTGSEFARVDEASLIGLGDNAPVAESKDTTDRAEPGCYLLEASAEVAERDTHHLMISMFEAVTMVSVTATWAPVA